MHDEDIFEAKEVMDENNIYEWGGLSVIYYNWYYTVLYNTVREDSNYTNPYLYMYNPPFYGRGFVALK